MDDNIMSRFYCCFKCRNIVALYDDVEKNDFLAGRSRGLLFRHARNVVEGPAEDRQMISGIHNVANVFCSDCQECLGWKYIKTIHKYKEGRIVISKSKISKAFDPPFYT